MLHGPGGRRRSSTPAKAGSPRRRSTSVSAKRHSVRSTSSRRQHQPAAPPPPHRKPSKPKRHARRKTNTVNDHTPGYDAVRRFPRFSSHTALWTYDDPIETVGIPTPERPGSRMSRDGMATPVGHHHPQPHGAYSQIESLWAKELSRVMYVDRITGAAVVLQKCGRGLIDRHAQWIARAAAHLRRRHTARRLQRWYFAMRREKLLAMREQRRVARAARREAVLGPWRALALMVGHRHIHAARVIQRKFYRANCGRWRARWAEEAARTRAVRRIQRRFRVVLARVRVRRQRWLVGAWEYPQRTMLCQRRGIATQEKFERNKLRRYAEYLAMGRPPPAVLFPRAVTVTPSDFERLVEREAAERIQIARRGESRFLSLMDALAANVRDQHSAELGRETRLLEQYDAEIARLNAGLRAPSPGAYDAPRYAAAGRAPSRSSLWCMQGTPVPETPEPREASPRAVRRGVDFKLGSVSASYTVTRGLTPEVVQAAAELWGHHRDYIAADGTPRSTRHRAAAVDTDDADDLSYSFSRTLAAPTPKTVVRPQSAPPYFAGRGSSSGTPGGHPWRPAPPQGPRDMGIPPHARTPTPSMYATRGGGGVPLAPRTPTPVGKPPRPHQQHSRHLYR